MVRFRRQKTDWDPVPSEQVDWQLEDFLERLGHINASFIYPHIFNNDNREVGGVLVGAKSSTGQMPLITGAIRALSADEQRATLTFTQETWEHVHREMAESFDDCEIVGWYHSHPGFGIFLSQHDLFIHHNFFSDESQVALVIDPIAGTEGVFTWQDGEVKPRIEQRTPQGWGPVRLADLDEVEPTVVEPAEEGR